MGQVIRPHHHHHPTDSTNTTTPPHPIPPPPLLPLPLTTHTRTTPPPPETKGEESTKTQKFQVFVKNLAGKTVVVRGLSGLDEVSLVVGHVESLTGVPRSLFYLVGASGRRLQEDVPLVQSGMGPMGP